jgi:hypothetical protein
MTNSGGDMWMLDPLRGHELSRNRCLWQAGVVWYLGREACLSRALRGGVSTSEELYQEHEYLTTAI